MVIVTVSLLVVVVDCACVGVSVAFKDTNTGEGLDSAVFGVGLDVEFWFVLVFVLGCTAKPVWSPPFSAVASLMVYLGVCMVLVVLMFYVIICWLAYNYQMYSKRKCPYTSHKYVYDVG